MQSLKVRLEINKGQDAIELNHLHKTIEEFHRLLDNVCGDINIDQEIKGWNAENFRFGSLEFDCVSANEIRDADCDLAKRAITSVLSNDRSDREVNFYINYRTRREEYAHISKG